MVFFKSLNLPHRKQNKDEEDETIGLVSLIKLPSSMNHTTFAKFYMFSIVGGGKLRTPSRGSPVA